MNNPLTALFGNAYENLVPQTTYKGKFIPPVGNAGGQRLKKRGTFSEMIAQARAKKIKRALEAARRNVKAKNRRLNVCKS
jgi:hypothetical protein